MALPAVSLAQASGFTFLAPPGKLEPRLAADSAVTAGTLYAVGTGLGGSSLIYSIASYASAPTAVPLATFSGQLFDVAIDPTTLDMYVLDGFSRLYRLDLTAFTSQLIGTGAAGANALAFDGAGRLYSWGHDGFLYRIAKNTGVATKLGSTGHASAGDLAFDRDGRLFGTTANGRLIRIDPESGASTLVGPTGFTDFFGLAIDTSGTIYGGRLSEIHRLDGATGAASRIGPIANASGSIAGFALAPAGGSGPNMTPFRPSGWSNSLVVSTAPFSTVDTSPLPGGQLLYLSWAGINTGDATIADDFFIDVFLDDRFLMRWQAAPLLAAGHYVYVIGHRFGPLAPGPHKLQLVLDAFAGVAESDEADNQDTKSFTVGPAASISVAGPPSGAALEPLTFTASGCSANPHGWTWTSTADLSFFGLIEPGSGVLDLVGGDTTSATLGWTAQGRHTVRARNANCPGAEGVATVSIGPPRDQTTILNPPGPLPDLPTVVFCHGLQRAGFDKTGRELWSCVGNCDDSRVDHPVRDLLAGYKTPGPQPSSINRVQAVWPGAGQGATGVFANDYIKARRLADDAGVDLAKKLREALPAGYGKSIHFIGHSLGSVVCGVAARDFLNSVRSVKRAQLTVLDRPDHVDKLLDGFAPEDFAASYGLRADYFTSLVQSLQREDLDFRLDNYWSTTGAGVGGPTLCLEGASAYNRSKPSACDGCGDRGLVNPGRIGDRYFRDEEVLVFSNDHSGVHQWYRWTVEPNDAGGVSGQDAPVCAAATFTPPISLGQPAFDASLSPCEDGWSISVLGPEPELFPEGAAAHCPAALLLDLETIPVCVSVGGASTPCRAPLVEVAQPATTSAASAVEEATVPLEIPPYASYGVFSLEVSSPSPSLWAAVLIDSVPVWSQSLAGFVAKRKVEIGPVSLYGLDGRRRLSLKVLGSGSTTVRVSDLRVQKVVVPCDEEDVLCLTAHRFRVEADWTDQAGNTGRAMPRQVGTDESGFMWFFSPSNLELMVKVLNGCGLNDRFWVFAAGLTDVAVRLTVTDTLTGAVKIYQTRQGTAFSPIQDTDAFATCTASDARSTAPRVPGSGTPLPGSTRLNRGRFEVTANWQTASGERGAGHLTTVTDDSGYLWFFDPANIEVAVKVLDACGLNDRYWVFAAGLTDVNVDLKVTDTRTGRTATYRNPLGRSFQPIQDTDAFATCP